MIRRTSIWAGRLALAVVALVVIALGLFVARLNMGPIELAALKNGLESQLSDARDGRPVTVSRAELGWGPNKTSIQLRARDMRALDSEGRELSRADTVVIGLRFSALLFGQVSITDAEFDGGAVTLTTHKDGSSSIAFGPPGAQPDIVMPAPPANESLRQKIGRTLDGLRATFGRAGPAGRLDGVSVRNAKLTIVDEGTGGLWTGNDATFAMKRAIRELKMRASANLKGPQGPAPFALAIVTDTAFERATIDLDVKGVQPQALGPFAPKGPLTGLTAPLTIAMKAGIDRKKGVTKLDGEVALGRGEIAMGGGKLQVSGGKLSGRYDVARDVLLISEVSLNGSKTKLKGDARILNASAIFAADPKAPARFSVASPQISFDMPGAFSGPVEIRNLAVAGFLKSDAIEIQRFAGQIDAGRINVAGKIYWGDDGKGVVRPGFHLTGHVDGAIGAKAIVRVWPLHMAEGARDWLGENLLDGRMYDVKFATNITPADLSHGGVPDDKLSLTFKYDRASVRYMTDMTPIVGAHGSAELKGNSFALDMVSGKVADLSVSKGKVLIPRIYPKGALATYSGRVEGDARSMIALLRQAPIGLDTKLPFHPGTIIGKGAVDFSLQRPLLSNVPKDALLFKVDGALDNAGGFSKDGNFTISQWKLRITGNQDALTFAGPLALGKSKADMTWTETLRGDPKSSSAFVVKGDIDAVDIMSLGFPVFEYASGAVGVDVRAQGTGAAPNSGNVKLDFRNTVLTLPKGFWVKPAGQATTVTFTMARNKDNTLMLNDIAANGPGVAGAGIARLSAGGDLMEANSSRLVLKGSMEGRVAAKRNAQGVLDVAVTGPYINLSPFFNPDPEAVALAAPVPLPTTLKPGQLSPAFEINAKTDKVELRGGAALKNATVIAGSDGRAMTKLLLNGSDPGNKPFSLTITPNPQAPKTGRLAMKTQDAGFAVRAITGQTNVKGGTAEADGTWTFAEKPTANIQLKMKNFRLVQVPAMAQLLGSVASLTGMVDMLNNDGIQFGDLEAPMTMANNQVTLGECRAAGPAIGLTAKGGINLNDGSVDIDGVIVPSYGLNSMLGAVPILGDLLVSRKGEGVFGLTYSMDGPADKPRVGVNPLSAFTPGIFRRIFEPMQKKPVEKAG